jgi:ATP-binding cassette subfamily B protein
VDAHRALNGQIEEAFTGHELVKVFGRQQEIEESFRQKNQQLYEASFGAQFISGVIMPSMMFIGNLNYVVIAVVGGLRVASAACRWVTCRRSSSTRASSPSR